MSDVGPGPKPLLKILVVPEAPACKVGVYARAVISDAGGYMGASLADAAKVSLKNAERDVHRLFDKYSLSLRVPISELKIELQGDYLTIPIYKAGSETIHFRHTPLF